MTALSTPVRRWAVISAALHGAALVLAALVLGPAARAPSAAERVVYVATHGTAWLGGWLGWGVATAALVVFFLHLRRDLIGRGAGRGLAAAVCVLAVAVAAEVAGHVINSVPLPAAARRGDLVGFEAWEELGRLVGAVAPQPMFGLTTLLFVRALRDAGASRAVVGLGVLSSAASLGMMAAAFFSPTQALPIATGGLVLSLIAFQVALARSGS